MRLEEINYNKSKAVMVFVTAEENCNEDVKTEIVKLRQKYKEVVVYVGGTNSIENLISNMIDERR